MQKFVNNSSNVFSRVCWQLTYSNGSVNDFAQKNCWRQGGAQDCGQSIAQTEPISCCGAALPAVVVQWWKLEHHVFLHSSSSAGYVGLWCWGCFRFFFWELVPKKIPFLTCWAPHTSHVVPSPPLLVTDEGENRNYVVTEGRSMCKLLHVQTR